jgi:methyl-accepting chemotaxis protein
MSRDLTFGAKVAGGFCFAGLVILTIAGMGYRSAHHLIENDRMENHTRQVRREIWELAARLGDAERGQRGFVITGKDDFLAPYLSAVRQIQPIFDEVKRLTADNPVQQARLDRISPLVAAKLSELDKTIRQRRTEGFDSTAKVVAAGEGRRYMDELTRLLTEMDGEEGELLRVRSERAGAGAESAKTGIVWGSLIGLILVGAVGFAMTRTLSRQIGSVTQHVQSSSAELQAAASQQTTAAKEQSTAMNEISTTISELLVTTRQIAASAQRVAQVGEQTASAAMSGEGAFEKARESIAGIRRQVDAVVTHMLDLGKKSQQIGAVLDIVAELAEQTNILAINATIEAAGAGEMGRRFLVVADEIRKLADRVTGSTKEIRSLIDDVRSAVNTTVMVTESGSKAVDSGTRQFGDVTGVFKQIVGLVRTTADAGREIELSTKQQSTAVEQVNVAIANVAQTSRETEASSGQTLQTASELAGLSKDLLRIIQRQSAA